MRAAVIAGAGPAVVSRLAVADDLATGRLRAVALSDLVLVRDLMVVAICVVVIREIYRPHLDLVRMTHQGTPGGPDPLAGVLADPGEPLVGPTVQENDDRDDDDRDDDHDDDHDDDEARGARQTEGTTG